MNSSFDLQIEETDGRLKITIPVRSRRLLLAIYSSTLVIWIVMLIIVVGYLIRGMSSGFVLTALLIIWLLAWFLLGWFLWGRWQHHAANRELLFIDSEQLIVRRPVFIFGKTTAYDMNHVSPFYISERHKCPAFDYAYMHVYFGRDLGTDDSSELIKSVNTRFFSEETTS